MSDHVRPSWGGDPSIAWRILLSSVPRQLLSAETVAEHQRVLHETQGWPAPPPVVTGEAAAVLREVAEVRDVPLVLGVSGAQLVVSAFHAYVDGLGLLEILAALTGQPVTSSARGVGDRRADGGGAVDRLREVALAPPASVALPTIIAAEGDAFAALSVEGRVLTTDLVHAAVAAIVDRNTSRGRPSDHVAIAVGAGRPATPGERLANRSELIRLRDLELLSLSEIETALRAAPLDTAGGSGAAGGRLARYAQKALASRLGSTLLVSHLGEVTTTAASVPTFYPVTAGGTGLSLGAVGHDGTTVLTLRGRAAQWDGSSLGALLTQVAERLT